MRRLIHRHFVLHKIVGYFNSYEVVSIFVDDPMSKRIDDGDFLRVGPFYDLASRAAGLREERLCLT